MIDAPVELAPCAETQMLMEETAKPTAKDSKDSNDPVILIISMTSMFEEMRIFNDFSIVFGLEMRCLNSNAFILTIFISFHFRNLMISDEAISTLVPPTAPWVLVSKEGRPCGRFVDLLLISDSIYDIPSGELT